MDNAKVRAWTLFLSAVACMVSPSLLLAQEQTTLQLPLPTGQAQTQSTDKKWQVTFDSNVSYFSTKTTAAGLPTTRSNVTYVPIGLAIVGNPNDEWKYEFGVRSGFQNIDSIGGAGNTHFSGWTDTTISNTLTYNGFNGYQPFVSLSTNAPTGKSLVTSGAAASDSDVTQIAGFGEGWNFGPTLGVNIPLTKDLIVTLSAGYTSRGSFNRAGPNSVVPQPGFGFIQNVNPGNVATLTSAIGYQSGVWSFQGSASYSYESVTMVDGVNFFRNGDRWSFSGAVGYAWTDALSSKIGGQFSHANFNRVPNPLNAALLGVFALFLESADSNSDTTSVTFDTTYKVGNLSLGPSLTYTYRNHNGYDSTNAQFLPARNGWTGGGAMEYAVNNQVSLNGRAQYVWATTSQNPSQIPVVPEINVRGWAYSFGGKVQF